MTDNFSHLGAAPSADHLLAHLALLSPGEYSELGGHADEADLSPLHPLPHLPVQGEALQLGLGQHRPDVRHLVQLQVQRLQRALLRRRCRARTVGKV